MLGSEKSLGSQVGRKYFPVAPLSANHSLNNHSEIRAWIMSDTALETEKRRHPNWPEIPSLVECTYISFPGPVTLLIDQGLPSLKRGVSGEEVGN